MTEEKQVVNHEEANPALDQEQTEQVNEQVESDISTTDGKDYKAIAEQLSRDIKEKNRKIQELKSQVQPAQPVQPLVPEEEAERRFIQTEANASIALMMQTDPTFKDRAPLVQDYVAQGYDIKLADKLAKADIMDKILSAPQELPPQPKPKQITTQAIPEQNVETKVTGNSLEDFLNDPNIPESAKEATRRAFSDRL